MTDALTEEYMSTSLLRVVERARREPEGRFHSLAHLLDVSALERAFHRLRSDAAVGVDGVVKEEYGQALEANLQDLHRRRRRSGTVTSRCDECTSPREADGRGR